ncbi:MAG: DNA gyrase inhibitor YacG [Candidatus Sulfotelmatobacter sp.]
MPRKSTLKLRCPICKKPVKNTHAEFPFCSDRCRTVDLGRWASGAYVILSPVSDEDDPIPKSTPADPDEDL